MCCLMSIRTSVKCCSLDIYNVVHWMQSKPLWCWINLEKKIVLEFLSFLSSQIKMVQGFEIHLHHDHVIKWKRFLRFWSFVRGIHRSPVNSPHTGQWRGALMFSLICGWINGWVNNREAGDLRRHRAHYDVTVFKLWTGKISRDFSVKISFAGISLSQQPLSLVCWSIMEFFFP